jgi:uncharacterized membrane protein
MYVDIYNNKIYMLIDIENIMKYIERNIFCSETYIVKATFLGSDFCNCMGLDSKRMLLMSLPLHWEPEGLA